MLICRIYYYEVYYIIIKSSFLKGKILDKTVFEQKYKNVKFLVSEEFSKFESLFEEIFSFDISDNNKNQLLPILKDFFSIKGKRIRPLLIFLFSGMLGIKENKNIYQLALADELLHNATLIHDDIIECSMLRRGHHTLNFDYDSKLAVLAGDFLLCKVMEILSDFPDENVRNIHSFAMSNIINGELNQYFSRYKLITIDEYIEKSKNKTACLFEAGIVSLGYLGNKSDIQINALRNFAINFGTAFQIKNDLDNFDNPEKINEDISNGDYTAPVIYYLNEKYPDKKINFSSIKLVTNQLKNSSAIPNTKALIKKYMNLSIENLSFLEDNLYKQSIIDLCNLYIE